MKILLMVLMLCALLLGVAFASTTIAPTDPNILYTGRWSPEAPSEPWCYWILVCCCVSVISSTVWTYNRP